MFKSLGPNQHMDIGIKSCSHGRLKPDILDVFC